MRVPASIFTAVLLLAGTLSGCGARRTPHSDRIPETERFWERCQENVPANPDGFQHFICTDVKKRQWEVLIRKGA